MVNNSSTVLCSFCKRWHSLVKCRVVADKKQRKGVLRRQGCCFLCLQRGHISEDCTTNISCHICKQHHHASICDNLESSKPTEPISQPSTITNPLHWQSTPPHAAATAKNEVRPIASRSNACNITLTMHVDRPTSALLQTAKASYILSALSPNHTAVTPPFILDTGSAHSYISEDLRSTLACRS